MEASTIDQNNIKVEETNNKNNDAKEQDPVPYIVHEGIMARMERNVRRLWILVVVLVVLLVGTNVAWLVYESQFEDQLTVTQDTPSGNNNYVGHDGDITNGKADNN